MRLVEEKSKHLESILSSESASSSNLRKQLKQVQIQAQDNEWQLQEQLAHINNQLSQEKILNEDIKQKLSLCESKLTEVEMYFTTERGVLALQLEQELASCKLRIAELEAEKDEMELVSNQLRGGKIKILEDGESTSFTSIQKTTSLI